MDNRGKIFVLGGGLSSEREISLRSGRAVYEALRRKGRAAEFLDVGEDFAEKLNALRGGTVFIALHGRFGEDGTVQAMLEKAGLSYTGSGVPASRLAMDKLASREVFLKNGLKVPAYKPVKRGADAADAISGFETPFVVKPQCEGSSIGFSIVSDKIHAPIALEMAFAYGDTVILEEYIHGREITVGMLEEKPLPAVEIVTKHNIYDYEAKYVDDGTKYIVPADLKTHETRAAGESALTAHRALGCRDFSRVDMRMDRDGNMYVLEVNTIPGLTERSLLPKAASAAGIPFDDLCVKLADLAERRNKWQGETAQKTTQERKK